MSLGVIRCQGLGGGVGSSFPLSGGQVVFEEGRRTGDKFIFVRSLFSKSTLSLPSQAPAAWRGSLQQCGAQRLQAQTELGSRFTSAF